MAHGTLCLQVGNDLCRSRSPLPDAAVHTDDILIPLVDDSIESNSGLPCLAIAQDELSLAAPYRD